MGWGDVSFGKAVWGEESLSSAYVLTGSVANGYVGGVSVRGDAAASLSGVYATTSTGAILISEGTGVAVLATGSYATGSITSVLNWSAPPAPSQIWIEVAAYGANVWGAPSTPSQVWSEIPAD